MKKALSILLVVMMLLSLAPMTLASEEAAPEPEAAEAPLPAEETETEPAEEPIEEVLTEAEEPPAEDGVTIYPLWVGGVQVNSANASNILGDDTARYDRATKTLTFSGLTGLTNYYIHRINDHYGVYTTEDLTVAGTASFDVDMDGTTYGIYSTGVLTIAEGADLTIRAWNDVLVGKEGVIINGGRINLTSVLGACIDVTNHSLVVNDGTVNLKSNLMAIDAQSGEITVNGGTVTATTTGEKGLDSIRLISGTLTVNGGVLDVTNTGGNALDEWDHVTYASTHTITEGSLDGSHLLIAPKTGSPLTRVELASVSHPVTGHYVKADAKLVENSHCTIYKQWWTKLGEGDEYTGKARVNQTYILNIALMPDAGYSFGPAGTEVPVTLKGEKFGYSCVTTLFGYEGMLLISWDYTTPPMYVSGVALTVTAPKAGAPVVADGERAGSDSRYVIAEQGWYYSDSLFPEVTGTFHDGGTYYYTALLETRLDSYRFIPPDDGQPGYLDPAEFGATVNGLLVSSVYWENDTIRIIIPFTVGDVYSGPVTLTGPSKPVIGGEIKTDGKISSSDYYIESQGWYEDLAGSKAVTDSTFQAGKAYIWICNIKAGSKVFPESYKGPVTVNGETVPKGSLGDVLGKLLEKKDFGYYGASDGVLSVRMCFFTAESSVLYGDVNNDGKVNPADRAALARYLAKWPDYQDINLANADVNGDGNVNPADRAYLARHFAKWPAYAVLGKPAG